MVVIKAEVLIFLQRIFSVIVASMPGSFFSCQDEFAVQCLAGEPSPESVILNLNLVTLVTSVFSALRSGSNRNTLVRCGLVLTRHLAMASLPKSRQSTRVLQPACDLIAWPKQVECVFAKDKNLQTSCFIQQVYHY